MTFEILHTTPNAYLEHLKVLRDSAYKNCPNEALFEYFGGELFHDGEIRSITCGLNPYLVRLEIESECIQRKTPSGDLASVGPIGFYCDFTGVCDFNLTSTKPRDLRPSYGLALSYIESEIKLFDASSRSRKNLEDWYSPEKYSLLIKAVSGEEETTWINIAFTWLYVTPKEPAAFALMESDPTFIIPKFKFEE